MWSAQFISMKKYKVAVVGYGNVAKAHITALNATTRAEVTAVQSSRSLDAAELSARHGGSIRIFASLDELLSSREIDAVSICGYPHQHAEQAVAAASAGKHVILEKPIGLSAAEAQAVERAVAQAGVRTCVCFELRFSNQMIVTKSFLDAGWLGTLHYGEIDYYHGIGPWSGQYRWNTRKASGGSSLLSAGCHALDALLLCMGGKVRTVTSLATRSRSELFAAYEYPTTSVTLLNFEDGRIGKVASVIDSLQPYYLHTHLVGSEGSLLDDKFYSRKLGGLDRHQWSRLGLKLADSGDVRDHPYRTQFEAFFEALDRGEDMPLTSLRESLETHRVILAADLSSSRGEPVPMEEVT